MEDFVKASVIAAALEQSNIVPLETAEIPYAVSPNFRSAIYIQKHKAWHIDNQGWRSMQARPPIGEEGREKLWIVHLPNNSKVRSTGFAIFIPVAEPILSLGSNANSFEIETVKRHGMLNYDRVTKLQWELITGHAEPEKSIEESFAKLFE